VDDEDLAVAAGADAAGGDAECHGWFAQQCWSVLGEGLPCSRFGTAVGSSASIKTSAVPRSRTAGQASSATRRERRDNRVTTGGNSTYGNRPPAR